MLGYASTRDVSLEEMVVLAGAVCRGLDAAAAAGESRPLLVGDMPFGTYEPSDAAALATARRFEDVGCDAVKLEGGGVSLARVRAIVGAGIPVMGHVGLLPQQVAANALRARGRTAGEALAIAQDARDLEHEGLLRDRARGNSCGGFSRSGTDIACARNRFRAGPATDGQVLVFHDVVGLTDGKTPRFVKRYARLLPEMVDAVRAFASDVRARRYPSAEHEYGMDEQELASLRSYLSGDG